MNRREICLAATVAALSPRLGLEAGEARAEGDLAELSLTQASKAIRARSATSRDLTMACLSRIDGQDSKLNALITVMRDEAQAQASVLDAEARANKFRSPLHGIPIVLKDAIDTAGTRTTAGSALYAKRVPKEDAHVVHRLRRAGAVIPAKSNLSEFSAESNGETLFSIENTAVFNVLGLPAISVPCGFSSEGLPIGLMICGPRFSEGRLLALAQQIERRREP